MTKKTRLTCCNCELVVFEGVEYEYEYPPGSDNFKEVVDGRYIEGAGKCQVCGKIYCNECGKIINDECRNCRGET